MKQDQRQVKRNGKRPAESIPLPYGRLPVAASVPWPLTHSDEKEVGVIRFTDGIS
jgi:hypothetical protein